MRKFRFFTFCALLCALFSCQSNVDEYQARKKKHFGDDYTTTITFEDGARVNEKDLEESVIEEGTFVTDTTIEGTTYTNKYKYLVAVSKADEPIEVVLSGPGINSGGSPQEMPYGEYVVGRIKCLNIWNLVTGNAVECLRRLVVTAQFDCCFSDTPDIDCWINCPLNPEDNWPSSGPF